MGVIADAMLAGFFDPLIAMFDQVVIEGFIGPSGRDIVVTDVDPAKLIDRLATAVDPVERQWLRSEDET